jgi:hypothetical protein
VPSPATRAAPQSQFDQRFIALPRRDDRRQVEFLPPVAMWTYRVHRVNAGIILGSWQIAHQRRSPRVAYERPGPYIRPTMTIVTTRPRKRPKPAQAALIKVSRIVQHTPRGRAWKLPPDDPEAKARAVASLARMIRPRS